MSNIYKCENCGGNMEFNPKTQTLRCENCGNEIVIKNDESLIVEKAITDDVINSIKATEKTSHTMECKGCGAKIEVESTSSATECPYCGLNYVLAEKQSEVIIPDGLVPFMFNKNDADTKLKDWVKGRFWAPNELKNLCQNDKIQGVYVPYWTFDADVRAEYTAKGGTEYTETYEDSEGETQTRTKVRWTSVSGRVNKFIDDYLVPASDKININLIGGLNSFDTKRLVSYSSEYISGYSAECFNVNIKEAHEKAINGMTEEMKRLAERDVTGRKGYDRVKDTRVSPVFNDETFKYVLLPIYSTAYKYKDKIYQVLINGQTGEISGEYPKSAAKIAIAVIIVILIIAIIFYFAR